MKEKLLLELQKKYAGQATTKFLESLAERLAAKVTKEEEIQGVLDELENSAIKVSDLQAEGDRRATELQTKFSKSKAEIEAEKQKVEAELEKLKVKPGPDDDNKIKQLEDRLAAFEQKEKEREVRSALHERAKAKNIPPALYKHVAVKSVDEIDSIVSDLEKEAQEIRQTWINDGVVAKAPPKSDGDTSGNEQVKSDIEHYSKNIK